MELADAIKELDKTWARYIREEEERQLKYFLCWCLYFKILENKKIELL